jgi:tRNA(Arg) A34 adenosine deaminase TadA
MDIREARERLERRLSEPGALGVELAAHGRALLDYPSRTEPPDDPYVWLACAEALLAIAAGNFGVGAVLVGEDGNLLAAGHNRVFHPHFRSDLHAEMVVLDEWENAEPKLPVAGAPTLYTSLEPCPMCLVRLSASAVGRVWFAAPDEAGGMVSRGDRLPPFWQDLARPKSFGQARCSAELIDLAARLFRLNLQELMERLTRLTNSP